MAGRRDGLLTRSNGSPSRGTQMAMAVGIGILLGSLCVFLYPDGLFRPFCTSPSDDQDSAAWWSQANSAKCETSERTNALKSELASLSETNKELKEQVMESTINLKVAEQGKDQAQKSSRTLREQQKAGPFGTVKSMRTNPTVIPDESDNESVGRTGGNHAVSGLKFRILREFLQLGYSILLLDVDIIYLQNPFDHLYRDPDIGSTSDGHSNMTAYGRDDVFDEPSMGWARYAHTMWIWVYNSGFFYIRPAVASIELLDRVADWMAREPNSWDQAGFNEELLYPSQPGYSGLHASRRTMDFYLFMNSKVLFKTEKR
ncbi:unnamed protein product [Musa hybrid cultivar]